MQSKTIISQWLRSTDPSAQALGKQLISGLSTEFRQDLQMFLEKQSDELNQKIRDALSTSMASPSPGDVNSVTQAIQTGLIAPVKDQIDLELQQAISQADLSFLPGEIEKRVDDAARILSNLIFERVVIPQVTKLYPNVA